MGTTRMLGRRTDGPPVYTYEAAPGVPPVSVLRLGREPSLGGLPQSRAHVHDFLVLAYFERGGGSLWLGDREWRVEEGDAYVIAPGEVVGVGDASGLEEAEGWSVFFPAEVLGSQAPGAFLSWRAHPLLFPFVRGATGGAPRGPALVVRAILGAGAGAAPAAGRLPGGGPGAPDAPAGGRGAAGGGHRGRSQAQGEPLLAEVFGFIEERYGEPISLKDVARAVSLSPGHLTTVVRRKTGRTVQEWIAERRMAAARRLLAETDLMVEEVRPQPPRILGWRGEEQCHRGVDSAVEQDRHRGATPGVIVYPGEEHG